MTTSRVKLKDIVGRPVGDDEAARVADHLLACLAHVSNARPLFGVLNIVSGELEWTAGGAEFHNILCAPGDQSDASGVVSFMHLFMCLGISTPDIVAAVEQVNALTPGASLSMAHPMAGVDDRHFRMVMRRRNEPNEDLVQFTILDISAFQVSASRAQSMAKDLIAAMRKADGQGGSIYQRLDRVLGGLGDLFVMDRDEDIAALAKTLSNDVTTASERLVELLRSFETQHTSSHWQPQDLDATLRPFLSVHSAPVSSWDELHQQALGELDGEPALVGIDPVALKNAYDFVRYAASVLVVSPQVGRYFVLNDDNLGRSEYASLDDFVRALGVEENSTRTAVDFFSSLGDAPNLAVFAMNGHNVEAWGRPAKYCGWQAMLVPSYGAGVDVRGLFHGLKNLLLHLQVLYVVKAKSDVEQVRDGLSDTAEKIRRRLDDLGAVAETGRRTKSMVMESVGQWLHAAASVSTEGDGQVVVIAAPEITSIRLAAHPGEMEDTFEELVRNAFLHGAQTVRIGATVHNGYLCVLVSDDGHGMSPEKMAQLHRVLQTRDYDATLSTREGGTGNGLLAAANAVSRFVDGRFSVDHGADGRGVEIMISMKLPA